MPWYTTGSTPGSFKNMIAGADSTPNLFQEFLRKQYVSMINITTKF